jgi:hypothetical protein
LLLELRNYLSEEPSTKDSFRYLSTDRLISWTKTEIVSQSFSSDQFQRGIDNRSFSPLAQKSKTFGLVDDVFFQLRDNLLVRIKVEAKLSQILGKSVYLREEGGFIIPTIEKGENIAYSFKEEESHGIKMMITMLTLLFDNTIKFFLIDEPELSSSSISDIFAARD